MLTVTPSGDKLNIGNEISNKKLHREMSWIAGWLAVE